MNYSLQDIYVLHPDWRLRNDGNCVIAGYYGQTGLGNIERLGPVEAVGLTMFDGIKTCNEIEDIYTAFFPADTKDPRNYTKKLMAKLLSLNCESNTPDSKPLLVRLDSLSTEEKNRIRRYQPEKFIIRPEQFKLQEYKLPVPASLLFLLTNKCETNCQYCYMPRAIPANDVLPWERMKELIYEAHSLGVMMILLSGGDPLCYPHIFDILELLSKLDFEPVELPTKAYVSEETAARIAQYRIVKSLQFSIDSTVPEIADYLVQRPGFCNRIMESIQNAQKAGVKEIRTKTVITPYNIATIPKLYRDLRGIGISPIVLATYCRSGYWHKDKLYNHPDDYKWLDEQLEKLKKEFPEDDISYQNGPPEIPLPSEEQRKETWKNRNRCTAGRDSVAICANGKVIACEQCPENEEDYLGDLRTQSIAEVWNGKVLDEYLLHPPRNRFEGTICYDCDEFDDCQSLKGACVREICKVYGTRWAPSTLCPRAPLPPREA